MNSSHGMLAHAAEFKAPYGAQTLCFPLGAHTLLGQAVINIIAARPSVFGLTLEERDDFRPMRGQMFLHVKISS